ncbi:MAG TPA: DMT family transporter [Candidatus Pacearchaeota archaeon]|nr:DMT family transporter [Candidatus Pacearchaeota archaeon]
MFYYLPVLGAVALAGGTILEKIVLIKRKINIKLYQTSAFLAIVISMLPLIYFFWKINAAAWQLQNIVIFLLVILFSMIANLLFFYSLKWEKIGNIEPARVLEPLFIILLAVVFSFFAEGLYERNARIVIPALIAGSVLVFSHIEKHHLKFNKYFIATILGSFFFALELVISRLILDFYSPVTFYFLRSSSIFLLSLIIFKPKFGKLSTKVRWTILATGAIWMAYRVILYYGYLNVGVVSTTLLLMLGPIFIYIFAFFFLKEKIRWKNFAAAIVIVGAIIYAITG